MNSGEQTYLPAPDISCPRGPRRTVVNVLNGPVRSDAVESQFEFLVQCPLQHLPRCGYGASHCPAPQGIDDRHEHAILNPVGCWHLRGSTAPGMPAPARSVPGAHRQLPQRIPSTRRRWSAKLSRPASASLLFLPPYSPDLMPIDHSFSKVKSLLRGPAPTKRCSKPCARRWLRSQLPMQPPGLVMLDTSCPLKLLESCSSNQIVLGTCPATGHSWQHRLPSLRLACRG